MLPDPLHPAIVHLPMALAVLLPLLTLCGLFSIHKAVLPRRAWGVIILLGFVLVLSSWVALETGEEQEERVERVVAEQVIEDHEEAAETFMVVGVILLLSSMLGMLDGKIGIAGRGASVLLAFVLLAAGLEVGHRGGALVYEHGAALAYSGGQSAGGGMVGSGAAPSGGEGRQGYGDDDDDD